MKKVKVRIAVAVDSTGNWNCTGWAGAKDDEDMMSLAVELLEPGEARYWLTAELEVPEQVEVAAGVEREGTD